MLSYMAISLVNLKGLGGYFYVFIAVVELLFVSVGISLRVKASILILFLISIVYNTLSFIEFNTEFSMIYDNYQTVMQGLILSLLFITFKNGVKDGTSGDHNHSNNTDNISDNSFFYRDSP